MVKMALLAKCQVSFVVRHSSVGSNGCLCVWLMNSFLSVYSNPWSGFGGLLSVRSEVCEHVFLSLVCCRGSFKKKILIQSKCNPKRSLF